MTVKAGGMKKRGAEAVADEKKEEESKFNPKDYSCEILLEKTTKEKSNDKSFPTDALMLPILLMVKNS